MIILKSAYEIELMREAGRISARALRLACEAAVPGVTTLEIDELAYDTIVAEGAKPAFLGYGGFRHTICASVNEELVHGIPSKKRILREGDIFTVDVGAIKEGYVGDNADTVGVGAIDLESQKLIDVTRRALYAAIEKMKPGNYLNDIGGAIEDIAHANGLGIIEDYVGHGIGRDMHEDPNVYNFRTRGKGPKLKVGMVFAIEPMLTLGSIETKTLADGWTVVMADGARSSQIEHTVAITQEGPQILTLE